MKTVRQIRRIGTPPLLKHHERAATLTPTLMPHSHSAFGFAFGRPVRIRCGDLSLRPLKREDRATLCAIALDPQIWAWSAMRIQYESELDAYLDEITELRQAGTRVTFALEHVTKGLVGATALGNYSARDQRIEIGWTWLGTQHQGSGVNTLAKAALLHFCFEEGNMERVEFKTDVLNQRSRAALRKIGCTEEGILRSHTLMPDGRRRDTIYYSILKSEWPNVRSGPLIDCPNILIEAVETHAHRCF